MTKSEARIQNEIRLALSEHGVVFRCNVGKVKMSDGRFFDTGLPKGFSDLLFCGNNGKIAFIECKDEKGKLRKEQKIFLKTMSDMGYNAGVARNIEEALKIINKN